MLFNRLADGNFDLPPYGEQQVAAAVLAPLRKIQAATARQLQEIAMLPTRILSLAFGNS